jgi:hypothetical protein
MTGTVPPIPIRERIKDLNTKAYYLLVALSFIYRTSSGSHSLKWAITLTALSAVLPVQDYLTSAFWLECFRTMKVICLTASLVFAIFFVWTTTAAAN